MQIRWSESAITDLEGIADYISVDRPSVAPKVARRVLDEIAGLESFPLRGRPGRVEGTRELVLTGLPFVVVYEVGESAVRILRVIHGAMRWPQQ